MGKKVKEKSRKSQTYLFTPNNQSRNNPNGFVMILYNNPIRVLYSNTPVWIRVG